MPPLTKISVSGTKGICPDTNKKSSAKAA